MEMTQDELEEVDTFYLPDDFDQQYSAKRWYKSRRNSRDRYLDSLKVGLSVSSLPAPC